MTDANRSDQLVAGVFSDHAAWEAARGRLQEMAPQLSKAGVTAVLSIAKAGDGTITPTVVDMPGGSEGAEALLARTRSALERLSGGRGGEGTPAAELGHALMPGAVAVGVFVPTSRAQAVEVGMQNLGARVLSAEDLKRIGAGMTGANTNGTLDTEEAADAPVTPASPVFDWQAEYAYSYGLQAFIYGFPYVYLAQCDTSGPTSLGTRRRPLFRGRAVLACPGRPGCHLPGWRQSEQRHDVFDRLGRPHRRAGDPFAPRHGRSLLQLPAGRDDL